MPIKYTNKIQTKVPYPSPHREVGPAQLARVCLTNESPRLSYFYRIIRIFLTKVDFDGKGACTVLMVASVFHIVLYVDSKPSFMNTA